MKIISRNFFAIKNAAKLFKSILESTYKYLLVCEIGSLILVRSNVTGSRSFYGFLVIPSKL